VEGSKNSRKKKEIEVRVPTTNVLRTYKKDVREKGEIHLRKPKKQKKWVRKKIETNPEGGEGKTFSEIIFVREIAPTGNGYIRKVACIREK